VYCNTLARHQVLRLTSKKRAPLSAALAWQPDTSAFSLGAQERGLASFTSLNVGPGVTLGAHLLAPAPNGVGRQQRRRLHLFERHPPASNLSWGDYKSPIAGASATWQWHRRLMASVPVPHGAGHQQCWCLPLHERQLPALGPGVTSGAHLLAPAPNGVGCQQRRRLHLFERHPPASNLSWGDCRGPIAGASTVWQWHRRLMASVPVPCGAGHQQCWCLLLHERQLPAQLSPSSVNDPKCGPHFSCRCSHVLIDSPHMKRGHAGGRDKRR